MSKERFDLKLEWTTLLAPAVRHFSFTRVDGQPFAFIPGQFISLHWPIESGEIKRSYSVASRYQPTYNIELAASFVEGGFASERLFSMETGDIVSASGPYGRLILTEDLPKKRVILVATSTGVTPYRAMLKEFIPFFKEFDASVVLLEGVQTREQLLYGEEFLEFAKENPLFQFRAYYSRGPISLPHEYSGYVQSAFDDLNLDPENDTVYLCGNPNMIDQAFEALKVRGFTSGSVRREKYISGK